MFENPESDSDIPIERSDSCWLSFGRRVQKFAPLILLALVAIAVPIAVESYPKSGYSIGEMPFLPQGAGATNTLQAVVDDFGIEAVFPTRMLIVPKKGAMATEDGRAKWFKDTCEALKKIARAVDTDPTIMPFTVSKFSGMMILAGLCLTPEQSASQAGFLEWSSIEGPYSATEVIITYKIDQFSPRGRAWLKRLRAVVEDYPSIGDWYISGEAVRQMDMADIAYEHFPVMIGLMLTVVFVLMLLSFRSIVAPIRAMLLLVFMLICTFGVAFLEWGAVSWMTPCIALPILIGLGLDYDIFYTEAVVEKWDLGFSEGEASVEALVDTANTISAAGAIMVFAFFPLFISTTPLLQQIGFLLVFGVLIDCFFTTKVVIPATVAFLGSCGFWPRTPERDHIDHETSKASIYSGA